MKVTAVIQRRCTLILYILQFISEPLMFTMWAAMSQFGELNIFLYFYNQKEKNIYVWCEEVCQKSLLKLSSHYKIYVNKMAAQNAGLTAKYHSSIKQWEDLACSSLPSPPHPCLGQTRSTLCSSWIIRHTIWGFSLKIIAQQQLSKQPSIIK